MSSNGIIILALISSLIIVLILWIERWPWHIFRKSTLKALKWLGLRQTITGSIHGIYYARWGSQYINLLRRLAPRFGKFGKNWLETSYHAKVLTHELATALISVNEEIPLQDLGDSVIPYSRARDIVLNESTNFVITDCVCKRDRHDHYGQPCQRAEEPYETCMFVGNSDLCNFLIDHKPKTSRRIDKKEALEILEKLHGQGLIHNAWFKSCIKDQFYVICNCCPCCCLGFESMKLGIRQYTPSGYVASINADKCKGCGECVSVCPFGAISIDGKEKKATVDWDKCYGCSVCVEKCPNRAKALSLDERKGMPLDVRKLVKKDSADDGLRKAS